MLHRFTDSSLTHLFSGRDDITSHHQGYVSGNESYKASENVLQNLLYLFPTQTWAVWLPRFVCFSFLSFLLFHTSGRIIMASRSFVMDRHSQFEVQFTAKQPGSPYRLAHWQHFWFYSSWYNVFLYKGLCPWWVKTPEPKYKTANFINAYKCFKNLKQLNEDGFFQSMDFSRLGNTKAIFN